MNRNKFMVGAALALPAVLGLAYLTVSPRFAKTWLYHKKIFKSEENNPCRLDLLDEFEHATDKTQHFFPAADGRRLHGWLFRNKRSSDVVLYCIGRTSCITNCLENVSMLLDAGYSVFIFEYRGFGASEGHPKKHPSIESICEDGVTAFDYVVRSLGYRAIDVTVYGESLGTGVATHITTKRNMRALILQSGFASLRRIGEHMMPFLKAYPRWLYPKVHMDTEDTLHNAHPPLLILHGQKDEVIPYEHAEILFKAAAGNNEKRLVALPNSMHRFIWHTDEQRYIDAVRDFRSSQRRKGAA